MKLIPIIATGEQLDIKKNIITYTSDVEAGPGILLNSDSVGDHEMIIIDQIHTGQRVSVKMKPIKVPARKFNVGEVVATLMVNE